jgi:hypothetical protein
MVGGQHPAGERERELHTPRRARRRRVRATNHAWPEVASTHSPFWNTRKGRGQSHGCSEQQPHMECVRRAAQLEGGEVERAREERSDLENELVDRPTNTE